MFIQKILKCISPILFIFLLNINSYAQTDTITFNLKVGDYHYDINNNNEYKYQKLSSLDSKIPFDNVLIVKGAPGVPMLENIETGKLEFIDEVSFNCEKVLSDKKSINRLLELNFEDFVLNDASNFTIEDIDYTLYIGVDSIIRMEYAYIPQNIKNSQSFSESVTDEILNNGAFISFSIYINSPQLDSNSTTLIWQDYLLKVD